jgi:hypothetical protein
MCSYAVYCASIMTWDQQAGEVLCVIEIRGKVQ